MDGVYLLIIVMISLPVLWGISTWLEAYSFKRKLYGLGHLAGRTKDDIIMAVGVPNSFSGVADGKELLQWQRPGYHIALLFKEGVCEGVTNEYKYY
jgi:hypothetical protein